MTFLFRPLDNLAAFGTACQNGSMTASAIYAIRQALDQAYQKYLLRQRAEARQARYIVGGGLGPETNVGVERKEYVSTEEDRVTLKTVAVKRDFFGRIIDVDIPTGRGHASQVGSEESPMSSSNDKGEERKVWVSFHEGFSNAVRKPVALDELMRGL